MYYLTDFKRFVSIFPSFSIQLTPFSINLKMSEYTRYNFHVGNQTSCDALTCLKEAEIASDSVIWIQAVMVRISIFHSPNGME